MMVSSSASPSFLALMIMASFLNRDCEAVHGFVQLIEVTHHSVKFSVLASNYDPFHVEGVTTMNIGDPPIVKNPLNGSAVEHIFTISDLRPFTYFRITVPDLKENVGGLMVGTFDVAGTPFDPSTVYFAFCTKPEPPTFEIGDSGATASSIPLKWSSYWRADTFDILLDGTLIGTGLTGTTYNVTHRDITQSAAVTAGTTYVCTLVAKYSARSRCADASTEPQTILCSTAQPAVAVAPTCSIPDAPTGLEVDSSGTTDSEIKIKWQEPSRNQGDKYNVFLNDVLMTTVKTGDTMEHVLQHTDSAGLVKLEANTAYVCKVVSEETTDGPCHSEPKAIACMTKPEDGDNCEKPSSVSVKIPKLTSLCILVIALFG